MEWEQGLDKGRILVPSKILTKKVIGQTIKEFLKGRVLMTAY